MSFTEHASKKYVDERDALLATKNALKAEAEERERLANIVAQNRRDTYTKEEVNRIVDALRGARFEKVQALPELAYADDRTIYLVPRGSPEAGNVYDEWIVVVDDEGARSWDKIGSTDIDLSGYAKTTDVQAVRDSVNALSEKVDELDESISSESSRISTLENKVDNPSFVPTEDSHDLISSGGVFAALKGKADKETDERFMRAKADVYLSARKGDDANDGLAPGRAVKTIGRAYAAAKAAVDAQTLDGTKQVVVAVDEGVYGSVRLNCELTAGIAFRAVGARNGTFVVPSDDPGDRANQTPMSCDNGVYPRVFEMEGFTFTGFNGRHHTDINSGSHQRGIVYGMTLRRCLITGNNPICTKAFVCGTFIDCEITGNAPRPTPDGAGGYAVFGGYGAVYDDLAYMTRMFNCHVWGNDFSSFQFFALKIEASGCLFENSFAAVNGVADSYGGHNNTMIAERYTNPYFAYSGTKSRFHWIGVKYFAVIASPEGSTTDPFYAETNTYVCVQAANLTEDKVAADASCPSVRSDGSPDFGYRDSGFGRKKTADGKADDADVALTPIYSDTPTFSEWVCDPAVPTDPGGGALTIKSVRYDSGYWVLKTSPYGNIDATQGSETDTTVVFSDLGYHVQAITATRTRTDIIGYQLGSQSDKPLASEAEAEALRQGKVDKPATFTEGNLAKFDARGNPVDGGKSLDDISQEIQDAIGYAVAVEDNLVPTEGPGTSVIETFQSGMTTWLSAQLPDWSSNANKNTAVFRNRPVNNNYYYNCPELLNRVVMWIGDVNKEEGQTAGYMERSLVFPKSGVYSVDVEYAVGLTYQRANAPRFLVSIGDKTQEVVGTRQIGELQKGHLLFSVQEGSRTIRLTATPGLGNSENAAAVVIASVKVTLVKEIGVEIGAIVAPDADAQTGQAADAKATYEALLSIMQLFAGKSYDLSDAADVPRALGDIITALGGTVANI